jgi:hypothetical protein
MTHTPGNAKRRGLTDREVGWRFRKCKEIVPGDSRGEVKFGNSSAIS